MRHGCEEREIVLAHCPLSLIISLSPRRIVQDGINFPSYNDTVSRTVKDSSVTCRVPFLDGNSWNW